MVREPAAMAAPVPAEASIVWDGRFRLAHTATCRGTTTLGALGDDAARFRKRSHLPSAVMRTLPALRVDGVLAVVPHLLYPDVATCERERLVFAPSRPACGAPFLGHASEARAS